MDAVFTAKLLAIPSGFLLGSYNAVFSQNVMPHLYGQPASVVAPLFTKIYNVGAATIPVLAVPAIASYGYLAYKTDRPADRKLYMTAAALMLTTLPMTQLVMMPGISRLIEISKDNGLMAKAGANEEVVRLLKTWAVQNYFRASLHLTAGFLGIYAALS